MKLKRITAILLAICTLLALTACSHEPEEIAWEGYEDMPFIELLEEAISIGKPDDAKLTVSVEEGWDIDDVDHEDAEDMDESEAEEPYTYYVEGEDGDEKMEYRFYMDVTDDDLLTVEGAVLLTEDKEPDFIGGSKAEDVLDNLVERYEDAEDNDKDNDEE